MKNIFTNLVAVFILVIACNMQAYSSPSFAGGSGTEADPYIILDAHHLNNVRNFPDSYFRQEDDIDFDKAPNNDFTNWLPIGGSGSSLRFTGHYDGNGHVIKNLSIYRGGISNVGLFGHVGDDKKDATTIKNLGLINVYVAGGRGTGALVGRVTGNQNTRIENCYVFQGSVSGDGATGGLVGSNNSYLLNGAAAESFRPVIAKCWTSVTVMRRTVTSSGNDKFGGLVGCNQKGLISNSYSRSSVHVAGGTRVGGLAGCIDYRGLIINSYSTGIVNALDPVSDIGGFAGSVGIGGNAGTAISCYWDITSSGITVSAAGTGLTTNEMKDQGSFTGWDFISTWQFSENENNNYPVLIDLYQPKDIWIWTAKGKDSEWTDINNWDLLSVPPTGSVVKIPFSPGIYPILPYNESLQTLIIEGNATLTFSNHSILTITGQLVSDHIMSRIEGEGAIELAGGTTQVISNLVFDNLIINNHNNVSLAKDIFVNGQLKMQHGLLDLAGHRIFLGENAELKEYESVNSSSRVFGNSGYIEMVRDLNNPTGNISGIGLEIETSHNLGRTTIRRGHSELNNADDSRSILRWFDIIPTNNENLNATIVFHYFIGELNLYNESANFSLFKSAGHEYYPGMEWIWVPSDVDAAGKRIIARNVESFSRWTAGDSDDPMPVSLLSFQATVQRNQEVLIEWVTASEINNDFFTVEKSIDGISWDVLAFVNGYGTTSQSKYYSARDTDPIAGISYYRLKQTDYDGTFEYFKPVSIYVENKSEERFTLYPNPNNGNFSIDYQGDRDVEWRIFDMQGRVIYSSVLSARNITSINLPQLPAGLYTVVFYSDEVISQKMMIR